MNHDANEAPPSNAHTQWQGDLWLGPDYCLIAGTAGTTHTHAHYAHQVLIALEGDVQALIDGQLHCGQVLVIESGQEHAIANVKPSAITLFAEPLAFDLQALRDCCASAGADLNRLAEGMQNLPRRALDPRLAKALERIRAVGDDALPAERLAYAASLSVSQLERLFTGTLGISVRRLVLWQRLRQATKLALLGSNLTAAAMAAGFADSAHLSRSMRRQFGVRADQTLRHLRLRVLD
ncbi:AraC family transcriptional regulator [Pseudomonas sp. M47T1]|uniref:helix-turn-helix domain-containing protein n=1 Tax=unclassified Pseudomonas TaxID=196821 RepID=UPI000260781D|nr:helix-turn-helix domain-containing protein [Pseudomonas sp. M47T1]EIK97671.1 AraC family transcriptional regulator [Pseudomonas sp. M47T1]